MSKFSCQAVWVADSNFGPENLRFKIEPRMVKNTRLIKALYRKA
jgi:hypothetical protein